MLRKPQNNTAFAKLSYLVNNCEPLSMGNSANVVFVARSFSKQIVSFSTTSWDRKRKGSNYLVLVADQVRTNDGFSASGVTISCYV